MFNNTPVPPIRRSLLIVVVVVLYVVWFLSAILYTKPARGVSGVDLHPVGGIAALASPTPFPWPSAGGEYCGCIAGPEHCSRPCHGCCNGPESTHCVKDPTLTTGQGCRHGR